jgi:hypothetical protein
MFKSKKIKFKMKLKTIIYTVSFMSLMFFNTALFAQDSSYDLITKELTKEQRYLLQKERKVMKTNRDVFKATLTKEQLAILRDKTISKSEIKSKLMSTFTSAQKDLVKNQQVRLRKTRDNFRKTLTGEQRKMLKERIDKIRELKDRGELKDGAREINVKDGKKRRVGYN